MQVQKVTDPLKIVTDPVLLSHLEKLGVDKDYVEFVQDYAPAFVNGKRVKGQSPYAKFYQDLQSGKSFAVISQLPMVDTDGNPVEAGWQAVGEGFESKNNLFIAKVDGLTTMLTVRNDQPDGRKEGHEVAYRPQLFLNNVEQRPASENAILLNIDPLNSNYSENTLEWNYGACKRRLRIIEGRLLGCWLFEKNPGGEVEIVYNQQGDFRLRLGQYAVGEDKEVIPLKAFDEAQYPFTISDSATFYPDAHPETSSADGWTRRYVSASSTWADIHDGAGTEANDDGVGMDFASFWAGTSSNTWKYIHRSLTLFDTHTLGAGATITVATISIYGSDKADTPNWQPNVNVYSSNPATDTAIVAADYSTLGTTAFCDTVVTYNNWSVIGYNDFILNATGIAAINKTGVSKFGVRNANYDVANSPPTWGSGASCYVEGWSSEKGTGYKPKLVVTYTTGEAKTSSDSGSGSESISLKELGTTEAGSAIEGSLANAGVFTGDVGSGSEIGGLQQSFYSSDAGSGADGLKIISGKAGADVKLRSHQGQVGLPHKEVSI